VTEERVAQVGEVEIAYDSFGDPGDPALLLIMGLGMQLIHWDPELCELLAGRGFHVIRFDNRDVGHSTKIDGGPPPNVWAAMLRRKGTASYTLDDMADDAAGVLDAVGAEKAHVAGASLGGMVAQALAARHPDRVLSLASIMSTTGNRWAGMPRLKALGLFMRRPPRERERYIEYFARTFDVIGSPGFPRDEARIRELAGTAYDRCYYPVGVARQLAAIGASGDRTPALRGIEVPTVVIHGADDPLIPLRGGRATARAIGGAELVEIRGMGHDLPREVWPQVVDAICRNAERAAPDRAPERSEA
jgi:pimeloyl-ACP methyl ester carboxylesterase